MERVKCRRAQAKKQNLHRWANKDFRVGNQESSHCCVTWRGNGHFTSLCLSFLTCKKGITTIPTLLFIHSLNHQLLSTTGPGWIHKVHPQQSCAHWVSIPGQSLQATGEGAVIVLRPGTVPFPSKGFVFSSRQWDCLSQQRLRETSWGLWAAER